MIILLIKLSFNIRNEQIEIFQRERGNRMMSILSGKETAIVSGLRCPVFRIGTRSSAEYLKMLSDAELLALYEKMDSFIAEEGEFRRSLGSLDEMYVIELFSVKNKIKSEYEKRTKSSIN